MAKAHISSLITQCFLSFFTHKVIMPFFSFRILTKHLESYSVIVHAWTNGKKTEKKTLQRSYNVNYIINTFLCAFEIWNFISIWRFFSFARCFIWWIRNAEKKLIIMGACVNKKETKNSTSAHMKHLFTPCLVLVVSCARTQAFDGYTSTTFSN